MTVAVCLKCGTMKRGALTTCPKCNYLPGDFEGKAKHILASDHHFKMTELENISALVQSGKHLVFKPEQLEPYITAMNECSPGKRAAKFLIGGIALTVAVIVGVIYLIVRLAK